MIKISISYDGEGEAAEVLAAIRNSMKVSRVKHLKDGRFRTYIRGRKMTRTNVQKGVLYTDPVTEKAGKD